MIAGDYISENLIIDVSIDNRKEEYYLDIILTNISNSNIKITSHDAPWMSGYVNMIDFIVSAVSIDLGQPLEIVLPTLYLNYKEYQIKPNQSLKGHINLSEIIPDLNRISKISDIVIFWTYKPVFYDDSLIAKRSGGWLIVKK